MATYTNLADDALTPRTVEFNQVIQQISGNLSRAQQQEVEEVNSFLNSLSALAARRTSANADLIDREERELRVQHAANLDLIRARRAEYSALLQDVCKERTQTIDTLRKLKEQERDFASELQSTTINVEGETAEHAGVAASNRKFFGLSFAFFAFLIIVYFGAVRFDLPFDPATGANPENNTAYYYKTYVDVSIMIFVGFGYLMTFLKKYAYGAVSYTYFISAFVLLWAILVLGFFMNAFRGNMGSKVIVNYISIIEAQFCAGAVMITFGGVIGKVTADQLLFIAFAEVIFYGLNDYIVTKVLGAVDVGGSLTIHTFGAYFGLALTLAISPRSASGHENNGVTYVSDTFSMIGTVFLYLLWPSFNGAEALPQTQARAIINTMLSITSSVFITFIMSRLYRGGKFNMVDVQNATLAGGVAMGASADLLVQPGGALLIGALAGFVSVTGFARIQPYLEKRIGLLDSCGIHNLHAMPGFLGGIVSAFVCLAAPANRAYYGDLFDTLFPFGEHQYLVQLGGLAITLGIAIVSGGLVGFINNTISHPPKTLFDDADGFEVPTESVTVPEHKDE